MKDNKKFYPPVVSVLGHVDHGKTTLLDAIRKTSIAQREHGGITQKIGASSIEVMHDGEKRKITFIDTPGHETFSKMRGRGANVADIGLLIISSGEEVKPQTKESIKAFKEANVPFIVVLTKSDLPNKNVEKIKQQLLKEEVMIEGYGGDIPLIEVSATTNHNLKELLDLILLVQELQEEKKVSESDPLEAVVIESRLDKRQGPLATIVIKNGTLSQKDEIICEDKKGKVRALINDKGENLKSVTIGDAIEILGFDEVPPVGGKVHKKGEVEEKEIAPKQEIKKNLLLEYQAPHEAYPLSVILVADTQGSLEAIVNALPKDAHIAYKKTGEVSEADVLFAKSIGGVVLSFNTKIRNEILRLAQLEKILVKNYTIIYELMDEVLDVLEGKALAKIERVFGKAKILASFPFEKTTVLGISVLEGRIAKGDKVRVVRNDEIIGESTISSVRQGKNQISKVEKGQECGVLISPILDFTIGDMLISHE